MAQSQTAKENPSPRVPIDPYKETLIVFNKESGEVQAASEIREADGKMVTVTPEHKNNPAFVEIRSSDMLANFISNFKRQCKDPTQFEFFRVPVQKVSQLVDALIKLQSDKKDDQSLKLTREFKVYPNQLKKIKFDACDIP